MQNFLIKKNKQKKEKNRIKLICYGPERKTIRRCDLGASDRRRSYRISVRVRHKYYARSINLDGIFT